MIARLRLAVVICCLGAALAACSAGSGGRTVTTSVITVGSGSSLESQIVAELYAQALQAKGVVVHRHLQIGAREIYLPSIEGGEVDLLPEYTGGLLTFYRPAASLSSAARVESTLRRALPSQLEILTPSPAQDREAVVVTRAFASRHELSTVADLSRLARQGDGLTLGVGADVSATDAKALIARYGLEVTRRNFGGSGGTLAAKALVGGGVDAAVVDTTNPVITSDDLVVLGDPLEVFRAQNVVPLIRRSKADATVRATLDAVSEHLTTDGLRRLDAQTTGRAPQSPAEVAAGWLKANDLG